MDVPHLPLHEFDFCCLKGMARKACIHFLGAFYHVIDCGIKGQNIFRNEKDYERYSSFLKEYKACFVPSPIFLFSWSALWPSFSARYLLGLRVFSLQHVSNTLVLSLTAGLPRAFLRSDLFALAKTACSSEGSIGMI